MSLEAEKNIISSLKIDTAQLVLTDKVHLSNVDLEQALLAFTGQTMAYDQALFDPDLQLALKEEVKHKEAEPNIEDKENIEDKNAAADEEGKENKATEEEKEAAKEEAKDEQSAGAQEMSETMPPALPKDSDGVNIDDVSIVSLLSPSYGFVFYLDEHLSEPYRVGYGDPILEQSVPRNLGIQNEFLGVIYHTFPVFPIEVPAVVGGPCCVNPINIEVQGASSSFNESELLEISNVLNNSFKFTFEYFCDRNEGEIIVSQVGPGIRARSMEAGSGGIQQLDFTPETFTIKIIVDPEGCCPPVNCDNPIESISIDITGNNLLIPCIDYFSSSYSSGATIRFLDSGGHEWELVNNKKEFVLQCADYECGEEEYIPEGTAPLVFDLDHNGYDISSVKDSSVVLNIDGVDKKVGWVGPNDGLLTYNYSGEGAIENKHFILTDNVQGAKTDLQALQMLAGQKEGILDMSNPIWDKLGMWQDGNQDGKMNSGEYHTLSDLKIASINLTGDGDIHKVNGNLIVNNVTFNYQDGSVGKAADAILKTEDVVQADQNIPGIGNASSAPAVAANDAVAAPVAPLQVDMAVQSAIEVQQPVAAVG